MRVVALIGPLVMLTHAAVAADRVADADLLKKEYEALEKVFFERPNPTDATAADNIRRYEEWPGWKYLPRFLALAQEKPDDEAAFDCCLWIIDRTNNVGNADKLIFSADQEAWEILAAHHVRREALPMLCLRAVAYDGPAQQRFLRGLLRRQDLSRENLGVATVALAELLARKHELIEYFDARPASRSEFQKFVERRESPDWGKDLIPANAEKIKAEAIQLFRDVQARYGDVPLTISEKGFRNLKNLGEKANQSLHALEHLTIGSEPPDLVGKDLNDRPLNLRDHRGKVVIISFWFTGCGPCMALVPEEQRLVKKYKERPFVLLGVCADESLDQGRKTATERGIDWPCWFDGQNGPIARDWNVRGWPTLYVLDQRGRIAAKNLHGEGLEVKVQQLLETAR